MSADKRTRVRAGVGAVDSATSTRSGYARDIKPELVETDEADGRAVPIATGQGAQIGRVSPARRQPAAQYEAVPLDVANSRRMARERGEMDPIEGGLDGPGVEKPELAEISQYYDDTRMETHDGQATPGTNPGAALGDTLEPPTAPTSPVTTVVDALIEENTKLKRELARGRTAPVDAASKFDIYFERRTRISFELNEGTYSIPAVAVEASPYGVIILLPLDDGDATFVPNPGAEVRVMHGAQVWDCFFPGTSFELPDLGVLAIAMVRKNEG